MRIIDKGETDFVPGDMVDKSKMQEINELLEKENRPGATSEQLLMGITKISLNTESFLAAASFQETTRVLIEAAVTGKTDYLRGLKENVIIGKLIPAGTGFSEEIARENLKSQTLPLQ
jgi:DNA-directed RNA polymerase subunit beta'